QVRVSVAISLTIVSIACQTIIDLLVQGVSTERIFVTQHELFSTQASVAIHVRNGFPGILLITFIFFGSKFRLLGRGVCLPTSFCGSVTELTNFLIRGKCATCRFCETLVALLQDLFEVFAQFSLS